MSTDSIHAVHANTYYDLAHLAVVQEQVSPTPSYCDNHKVSLLKVLRAAQVTEPFDYTLAIVMYHHGNQLLIPCLPDTEFNPDEDIHVVAIPADYVLSKFIVHINPHLRHV